MEVVPLSLELGGGVHLVRHDARNGLKENIKFFFQKVVELLVHVDLCILQFSKKSEHKREWIISVNTEWRDMGRNISGQKNCSFK